MTTATVDKQSNTNDVLAYVETLTFPPGTECELVGAWVWVKFPAKPPADLRSAMSSAGFTWVNKRGKWAHSCGVRSRASKNDPRDTYGAQSVQVKEDD